MSMNVVERIDDFVKVRHVLASVFDKSGLETFIPELIRINPEVKIFSTGGTVQKNQGNSRRHGGFLPDTGFGIHGSAGDSGWSCEDSGF